MLKSIWLLRASLQIVLLGLVLSACHAQTTLNHYRSTFSPRMRSDQRRNRSTYSCALPQSAPSLPAPRYTVTDLGRLSNSLGDIGPALSPTGVVAGWTDGKLFTHHASLWTPAGKQDLGTLPGFPDTYATGINAKGQVVGIARAPGDARYMRAFLWQKGILRDLGALGGRYSSARAINAHGLVVGSALTRANETHAFLWRDAHMRDLGTLAQGNFSVAQAINQKDQIVGAANLTRNGQNHAFLYAEGRMQDLGLFPNGALSTARAINDQGQVVGWADIGHGETHPFLWDHGQMQDLGTLGDEPGSAWGINNHSQVVGASANKQGRLHAFLWEAGKMEDLNSDIPPDAGWTLQFAYQINDRGQIVGKGMLHRAPHAFLLTPVATAPAVAQALDFKLADVAAQSHSLRQYQGHPVALCFFCGCQWCRAFAQGWGDIQRSGVLVSTASGEHNSPKTLVVFAGDAEEAQAFAEATHLEKDQTILLPDPQMKTALAYQAIPCPRLYALDAAQAIRYTNNHADDAPQKAQAVVLISRMLDTFRAMDKERTHGPR